MALSNALLSKNQKDGNSEKNYRCTLRAKKNQKNQAIKDTEVMQYSTPNQMKQ